MHKLEYAHKKLVKILKENNIAIGMEETNLGPVLYLLDLSTGDQLNWHEGKIN